MKHIKLKTINLKSHPQFNERWLQDIIAEEPTLLGIGDVILKDKERIHVRAGRLDLLLQDADGHGRYEVEIQLGGTDESHIIRTIEYWDIERRKYPQYDHTAVIIAEDITSRFLNVISLFNGFIPIMAIQVTAIETPEGVGLQFTKILDTIKLGYLEEDEETAEPTDRNYWETIRGTRNTVSLVDRILAISKVFSSSVELSYNKHYIGFWVDGRACNFAICRPQKNALRLEITLPQTEETDELITNSELDFLDYDKRWGNYRLKLTEKDISGKEDILGSLLKQAYELRK
jgi:predicted transport protein